MEVRRYSIWNQKRDSEVCSSVRVIDATLEPLTILKVLVEGLTENSKAGLWLINMTTGIPMVPRISPFDLLYLDEDNRVLQGVELLPADDFPPFKRPASCALVLPLQSITMSKTGLGDELIFSEIDSAEPELDKPAVTAETTGAGRVAETAQEPLAAETEDAPFELDACAPEQRVATVENEAEVVLVAPREAERKSAATELIPKQSTVESGPPAIRRYTRPTQAVSPEADRNTIQNLDANQRDAREKDWVVARFLRWLYPGAYEADRRKGRRIPIPNLVAYDTTTGVAQAFEIGDISATGMFLITEERWPAGSVLSLSLQREGPQETGTERRIQLRAGAVRAAKNGVGLSFVLPNGMQLHLWEEPSKEEQRRSEPEYVIREFRMARALSFIGRISHPAIDESRHLIYKELSNVRSECAVNIFLKAEQRLAQEEGGDTLLAHPDIVVGVVDGGSWADTAWMQDLWAGLLASSCTADGSDDSNLVFLNLLSQLSTIQTRVLAAICEKAVTVASGDWVVSSEKIFLTADEMAKMAGSHDMLKIHRSLAQLAEFGLLEKTERASFVSEHEGATTTPTSLGLRMYSRCLGRRGDL